jgi:hypothetical protein
MICQNCGLEAPTADVEFRYSIGLLITHIHHTIKGVRCKSCIRRHFWECMLINLSLGWWNLLSLMVTPFLVVHNVFQYLSTRSLPPVPPDARAPELDERALRWLAPHEQDIRGRLRNGARIDQLAGEVSARAGVTPGQVQLYVAALANQSVGADIDARPLAGAHAVLGPHRTWRCSVCGGYVRQDATLCKHCKASFQSLAELMAGPSHDPHAPAHIVRGASGGWTCSACRGYVRQDADFCKHCKLSFSAPKG